MLDTVHISVPYSARMPSLERVAIVHRPDSDWQMRTGWYRGLKVIEQADGQVKIQGSLPTFLWGNNASTMKHSDVIEAVDQLEDAFKLNPSECKLMRIDVAATIEMPNPCVDYFNLLGSASGYKRAGVRRRNRDVQQQSA